MKKLVTGLFVFVTFITISFVSVYAIDYVQQRAVNGQSIIYINGYSVNYYVDGVWKNIDCSTVYNDYLTQRITAVLPIRAEYSYYRSLSTLNGSERYEVCYIIRDANNHSGGTVYCNISLPSGVSVVESNVDLSNIVSLFDDNVPIDFNSNFKDFISILPVFLACFIFACLAIPFIVTLLIYCINKVKGAF